jgi:hypothetical protein
MIKFLRLIPKFLKLFFACFSLELIKEKKLCELVKAIKAPALKESSFGTNGDRQTFFDQIFNFCLHNIIVRKVLSNFCFWGPIRFVHWLEIDPVPSWRPGFSGFTGKPDLKKFYLFKDKSFWLEIFFIFQGYTSATFLYTFHNRWTSVKFSG